MHGKGGLKARTIVHQMYKLQARGVSPRAVRQRCISMENGGRIVPCLGAKGMLKGRTILDRCVSEILFG